MHAKYVETVEHIRFRPYLFDKTRELYSEMFGGRA